MVNRYLEGAYIYDLDEQDFSGKIIELRRKIDLAKYNDYETEAKAVDWQVRCDSENEEFDIVSWRILKTYADRFILQASEDGIRRYEEIMEIESKGTLEERRKKVFFAWNKNIVYTHRSLTKILDGYLGKNMYDLELVYNDYELWLNVKFKNNVGNVDELFLFLRDIIPANLMIKIRLLFNDDLILIDKTRGLKYPLYTVGHDYPCGRVYKQAYKGKKYTDTVALTNHNKSSDNRPYKVNQIKTQEVPK